KENLTSSYFYNPIFSKNNLNEVEKSNLYFIASHYNYRGLLEKFFKFLWIYEYKYSSPCCRGYHFEGHFIFSWHHKCNPGSCRFFLCDQSARLWYYDFNPLYTDQRFI